MTTAQTSARRTSALTNRPFRLAIDGAFLALALIWMIQDWDHHSVWTAAFWAALAAFWMAMLAFDSRRADLGAR
jgi:hypothetical protein